MRAEKGKRMDLSTARRLLIVCSIETGDIFRVFPDGTACEIHSERDLNEPENIAALTSYTHDTAKFLAAGDDFEPVTFDVCMTCDGSGKEYGPTWITQDDAGIHAICADRWCACESKKPAGAKHSERAEHPCCDCKGRGYSWMWSNRFVKRADLPQAAA